MSANELVIGLGIMALVLWPALAAGFRPEGIEEEDDDGTW